MPVHLYSGGQWNPLTTPNVYTGGQWVVPSKIWAFGYVNDGNGWSWREVWPGVGSTLPPGTYVLGAQTLFLPGDGSNGYATFDLTGYTGRITAIWARMSWKNPAILVPGLVYGLRGRPSNTSYRNITTDDSFAGRTIDHRVDTFNASALTEFNSGAANGFNLIANGLSISASWSNVQLKVTIS